MHRQRKASDVLQKPLKKHKVEGYNVNGKTIFELSNLRLRGTALVNRGIESTKP